MLAFDWMHIWQERRFAAGWITLAGLTLMGREAKGQDMTAI